MTGNRRRWDAGRVARAARQLKSGEKVATVAEAQGCSKDKVRAEVQRAMGEAWWAEHVNSKRAGRVL